VTVIHQTRPSLQLLRHFTEALSNLDREINWVGPENIPLLEEAHKKVGDLCELARKAPVKDEHAKQKMLAEVKALKTRRSPLPTV
jgi:hypothetical protein